MVGPGARKPSVGEGIESRRPLFLSFSLSLSYFVFFTPILVCEITIIIIIIIIIYTPFRHFRTETKFFVHAHRNCRQGYNPRAHAL